MGQVIQSILAEPENTVEIVVHITEELSENQRDSLISALEHSTGITNAEF